VGDKERRGSGSHFWPLSTKFLQAGTSCLVVHCHIAYIPYKLPMFSFLPHLQTGITTSGLLPKLVSCLILELLFHCYPGDVREVENGTFSFSP